MWFGFESEILLRLEFAPHKRVVHPQNSFFVSFIRFRIREASCLLELRAQIVVHSSVSRSNSPGVVGHTRAGVAVQGGPSLEGPAYAFVARGNRCTMSVSAAAAAMASPGDDTEVRVAFFTRRPEFVIPDTPVTVPGRLRRAALSVMINHLLQLGASSRFTGLIFLRCATQRGIQRAVSSVHCMLSWAAPALTVGEKKTQPTDACRTHYPDPQVTFDFLVAGEFLRTSLSTYIDAHNVYKASSYFVLTLSWSSQLHRHCRKRF